VPGSRGVPELARRGQLRVFSKDVKTRATIERISLESFNNSVAPTVVGITAELPANGADIAPAAGSGGNPTSATGPGTRKLRTLIVGAGSAHDFKRWFLEEDAKTLSAGGGISVKTTGNPNEIDPLLDELDVLYLSNNAPFTNSVTRQRVLDFANSGKGLVLVHPALWYNWGDWPEYNRKLCGGGSRGHDRYGEFEVTVTEPDHPLTQGLPAKFTVQDELYWFEPDTNGSAIKVLATAYSATKKKRFPMIFTVEHPRARIVAITLGHDGAVHQLPVWHRLLENAVRWAAAKDAAAAVKP
jgi:type 1 glutamine amidotransferase